MSKIELINASCADQEADVIVNAANSGLWAGGGICGVIFRKAGMAELTEACKKYKTPLKDGDAVITPAFNMTNAKAIIHAVGPNFVVTLQAFKEFQLMLNWKNWCPHKYCGMVPGKICHLNR